MTAKGWLKAELKAKYGEGKGENVFTAILNDDEIQFSSPESKAEFEAILKEWDRREWAEAEEGEDDIEAEEERASYPASTHSDPNRAARLAEFHARQKAERPGISEEMAYFLGR